VELGVGRDSAFFELLRFGLCPSLGANWALPTKKIYPKNPYSKKSWNRDPKEEWNLLQPFIKEVLQIP
jgi:hypothetical protein